MKKQLNFKLFETLNKLYNDYINGDNTAKEKFFDIAIQSNMSKEKANDYWISLCMIVF